MLEREFASEPLLGADQVLWRAAAVRGQPLRCPFRPNAMGEGFR